MLVEEHQRPHARAIDEPQVCKINDDALGAFRDQRVYGRTNLGHRHRVGVGVGVAVGVGVGVGVGKDEDVLNGKMRG